MASRDTKLNIIVDAQNRTQGTFNNLKNNLDSVKRSHEGLISAMRGVGVAGTIALGGLTALTMGIVKAGASFEQTQIAFETMLGSGEKAQKLLEDLADFGKRTPFELPQLEEAAKRLLAYGIAAEELLPTLEMLGDLSAGVGMDKLPQLILAFGQVSAATRLTGMELRQFSEAGIPLLGALVDHFNNTSRSITTVTNAAGLSSKEIDKLASANSKLEDKLHSLNLALDKRKNRMREMRREDRDSGAAWKNLKIDIEETERQIAEVQSTMESNNKTLALAGQTITKVGEAAKVTAADIQDMVSEGEVSFGDVQAALASLTGEGGRFNELMEKQSQTLSGMWSNLQDEISLTARAIGEELLPIAKPLVEKLIEITKQVGKFAEENPKLTAGIIGGGLAFAAMLAVLLPISIMLPGLLLTFSALGTAFAFVASGPGIAVIATLGALGLAITQVSRIVMLLKNDWDTVWLGIKIIASEAANSVIGIVEGMINFVIAGVNKAIDAINKVIRAANKVPGVDISNIGKIDNVDFGQIDTDLVASAHLNKPTERPANNVVNILGGTYLSDDVATDIGNRIMNRLKMNAAL